MNIVIDANVFFSALIKDSINRKFILEYGGVFLFPSYIFTEFEKHKQEIIQASKMPEEDFNKLYSLLLSKVNLVPEKDLLPHKEKALELVKDIDIDDVLFVACVLAYPNSVLWSYDKQLKNIPGITVINTKELIDLFE